MQAKRDRLFQHLCRALVWVFALAGSPVHAGWGVGELMRLVPGWHAPTAGNELAVPPALLAPLEESERHAGLTQEQRQEMREQMREQWQGMTPDERAAHRRAHREERPPIDREERQRIRQEMMQSAPAAFPGPLNGTPHAPPPHRRRWD